MAGFRGFPEGRARLTPLPGLFFEELLPQIDHLGELKVVLYVIWCLDHKEGAFRYVRGSDIASDHKFLAGLGATPAEAQATLEDALRRATDRGVLLAADLGPEAGEVAAASAGREQLYFLNSPKGRAAIQAIQRGLWQPAVEPEMPLSLGSQPPDIFRLYEEHIGPLTPMISETLAEAEKTYPPAWIEEAVRIAVESNKRSWRYVAAILKRWLDEGRDERKDRQDSEKARRRYADWEN